MQSKTQLKVFKKDHKSRIKWNLPGEPLQSLIENKRAQRTVEVKRSCVTLEQVKGIAVGDLRLDFYGMMKKQVTSHTLDSPTTGGK